LAFAVNRQIDVLIVLPDNTDNSRRNIVDTKARSRRIEEVHALSAERLYDCVGAAAAARLKPQREIASY